MGKDYEGCMIKGSIAFKPCGFKVLRVCMNVLYSQISRFLGLHVFKINNEDGLIINSAGCG